MNFLLLGPVFVFLFFQRTWVQQTSSQIRLAGEEDTSFTSGGTVLKPRSLSHPCVRPPLYLSQCKQITLSNTQCLLPALQSSVFFMRDDKSLCNPFPLDEKVTSFLTESLSGSQTTLNQTVTANTPEEKNVKCLYRCCAIVLQIFCLILFYFFMQFAKNSSMTCASWPHHPASDNCHIRQGNTTDG